MIDVHSVRQIASPIPINHGATRHILVSIHGPKVVSIFAVIHKALENCAHGVHHNMPENAIAIREVERGTR